MLCQLDKWVYSAYHQGMEPVPLHVRTPIKASHIRVPFEISTLIFTLVFVLVLIFLLAIPIDFIIILFALAIGLFVIIIQQGIFLGNAVKVSEVQFAEIHKLAKLAIEKLDLPVAPRVYIVQDPYINAFTFGFGRWHSVILHSATVEALTQDELLFIIGHEMGHIKASHALISSIIMPFGNFLPLAHLIFGIWWRKAELTADRAGAIVVPNIAPAISGFAKLAIGKGLYSELNIISFLEQGKEVDKRFADQAGQLLGTHPYLTNRIKNLTNFVGSPRYHELVSESFGFSFCPACGAKNSSNAAFCASCGKTM